MLAITRTFTLHRLRCLFGEWTYQDLDPAGTPGMLNLGLLVVAHHVNAGR